MFASEVSTISVIIPTLNEAENIAATLCALRETLVNEVIVVDGGSSDDTCGIAEEYDCRVVPASRSGRASQLNEGAAKSSGDLLVFLHADTIVSVLAIKRMKIAMGGSDVLVGGGFARRFASRSLFLAISTRLAGLRSRWFGLFLGDQGMFVRKDAFALLGGFCEEMGPGEDLDFSVRMRRLGKTITITPPVVTSARRFEERGPARQTLEDWRSARDILKEVKERSRQ